MGIDRIGQGGPPVPADPGTGASSAVAPTGAPFRVQPAQDAGASGVSGTSAASVAPTPLQRLQAGEIDLGGYVDLKVDEATAHLAGLAPGQLASLKSALRDRMTNDPTLVDLLQSSTGATLPADAAHDD